MRNRIVISSGIIGFALFALATWSATAGSTLCPGDCDDNGSVTDAELATGVDIALLQRPDEDCPALGEGDVVDVAHLVDAVSRKATTCVGVPTPTATPTPTPTSTATPMPTPTVTPGLGPPFCDLPGSVQSTGPGISVVPGGAEGEPDLTFLDLPIGFCAHYYGRVGNTRELRFAPGGDLFVASPTKFTTGGGVGGQQAIVILPDDDGDGYADGAITYLGLLPATQGLLFTGGYLYYQNDTRIMRTAYSPGDRAPTGASEEMAHITLYRSNLHWPKPLDVDDDGTIYVGNGGDEITPCTPESNPFRGGILALDGTPGGRPVAMGFRNPISLRCLSGHNTCFAIELARDYSNALGGREKLVPIREGDDWGFPCCATTDVAYSDIRPVPDCSQVASEIDSFVIGHTPFDLEFELGRWPAPWTNRAFVPLHGVYGTWEGARVVAIERDTMTGQVLPGSDLPGVPSGGMSDFVRGWDDKTRTHGRPATAAFAPDGRLFLGNDVNGHIIWVAPMDLTSP